MNSSDPNVLEMLKQHGISKKEAEDQVKIFKEAYFIEALEINPLSADPSWLLIKPTPIGFDLFKLVIDDELWKLAVDRFSEVESLTPALMYSILKDLSEKKT